MRRLHFSSVCVAIVSAVFTSMYIATPKAFSQQECNKWPQRHAAQMNMEADGERSMFMLIPPGDPLPVVCLVRYDPFQPKRYDGIGTATRDVRYPEAQAYFNQGLQFYYAFNNRESYRAARCAASIASKGGPPCVASKGDPACAWCYVVQALALGPDINRPRENELDRKAANQVLLGADTALKTDLKRGRVTIPESAEINVIIQALKKRFEDCPTDADCQDSRNHNYQQALAAKFDQYKDDPDYVILFADAAMNQTPWGYWKPDGSPKSEAIAQSQKGLETALDKNPKHNGLIHWYIHLMEMSGQPNLADRYARQLKSLAPNAGHLVHMPSHIYYRLGNIKDSIGTNADAVKADQYYFDHDDVHHPRPDGDRYRFGYYPHNIHFELASAVLIGQRETVAAAAETLLKAAPASSMAYRADRYRAVYYLTRLNFASATDIRKFPHPGPNQGFAAVAYDYALVVADTLSSTSPDGDYKKLKDHAQTYINQAKEKGEKNAECDPSDPDTKKLPGDINLCVIRIMDRLASARISTVNLRDPKEAGILVMDAAKTQHALPYDEPPAWLYPVDQTFAGLMLFRTTKAPPDKGYLELAMGHLETSLQEKQPLPSGVFLNNAWAYFGLWQIAEKLGLKDKAQQYKAKYDALWQGGNPPAYLQM